jgi:hypothetical protein
VGLQELPARFIIPMRTVLRFGPYRFFFYAGDREEPPHVHVEREDRLAKFWLEPVRLQRTWVLVALRSSTGINHGPDYVVGILRFHRCDCRQPLRNDVPRVRGVKPIPS